VSRKLNRLKIYPGNIMPELPDLELFARNLAPMLQGKILDRIEGAPSKNLKTPLPTLKAELLSRKLLGVYRQGKELRLNFGKARIVGVHLMLRGKLSVETSKIKKADTIIRLEFRGGRVLTLSDPRKMATLTLNPPPKDVPDALEVTRSYLGSRLAESKARVKSLLTDQKVMLGIGNAYADEILWKARISPFSVSSKIPAPVVAALVRSIKIVLRQAITQIDRSHPGITEGEVRDFLIIHQTKRKKSPAGGAIRHTSGASKTYYTAEQVLYK
jgi:formamidopyrimidine-DNA glycosylase